MIEDAYVSLGFISALKFLSLAAYFWRDEFENEDFKSDKFKTYLLACSLA